MTKEEAKHIVDVAFCVPQAIRRAGENRTYFEDEIREAKGMALKALEQDPCEDAISRQAMFNILIKYKLDESRIAEELEELTPVTPQLDWIPVSRDLPKEKDGFVLVTMPDKKVRTAQYSEFSDTWYVGDMMGVGGPEPIAWMLPTPYEPQKRSGKG